MGTIIYKPHCAKCGALIADEVSYLRTINELMENCLSRAFCSIQPNRCKVCGEYFSVIEIKPPVEVLEDGNVVG